MPSLKKELGPEAARYLGAPSGPVWGDKNGQIQDTTAAAAAAATESRGGARARAEQAVAAAREAMLEEELAAENAKTLHARAAQAMEQADRMATEAARASELSRRQAGAANPRLSGEGAPQPVSWGDREEEEAEEYPHNYPQEGYPHSYSHDGYRSHGYGEEASQEPWGAANGRQEHPSPPPQQPQPQPQLYHPFGYGLANFAVYIISLYIP